MFPIRSSSSQFGTPVANHIICNSKTEIKICFRPLNYTKNGLFILSTRTIRYITISFHYLHPFWNYEYFYTACNRFVSNLLRDLKLSCTSGQLIVIFCLCIWAKCFIKPQINIYICKWHQLKNRENIFLEIMKATKYQKIQLHIWYHFFWELELTVWK